MTIHRIGSYAAGYELSLLEFIAGKTKVMADEFLHENGHDVTDKFVEIAAAARFGHAQRGPASLNRVPKILKA